MGRTSRGSERGKLARPRIMSEKTHGKVGSSRKNRATYSYADLERDRTTVWSGIDERPGPQKPSGSAGRRSGPLLPHGQGKGGRRRDARRRGMRRRHAEPAVTVEPVRRWPRPVTLATDQGRSAAAGLGSGSFAAPLRDARGPEGVGSAGRAESSRFVNDALAGTLSPCRRAERTRMSVSWEQVIVEATFRPLLREGVGGPRDPVFLAESGRSRMSGDVGYMTRSNVRIPGERSHRSPDVPIAFSPALPTTVP